MRRARSCDSAPAGRCSPSCPRCPVEQARLFRQRLLELGRREGVRFEHVEFADEGHGSNDIEQEVRTFHTLADYLDRVLG